MKKCKICNKIKDIVLFHDKYTKRCADCANIQRNKDYYKNHSKELQRRALYREGNREHKRKHDNNKKRELIKNLDDSYIIKLLKQYNQDINPTSIKNKRDSILKLRKKQGYIYYVSCKDYIKIGYTNNPKLRLSEMQTGNPYKLKIIKLLKNKTQQQEKILHKKLKSKYPKLHKHREWYYKDIINKRIIL